MYDDVISARLHRRIRRDFPDAEAARGVAGALRVLADELAGSQQDPERLMAAAVFFATGDINRFRSAIQGARKDWRDLLMAGGLGYEGWPSVLDEELGPASG
ncbi:hypothetical protein ABZ611_34225 [Streptomyces sp. NPDC007861]|uniref:hypothetical protein n=1 Tax=Streptomyces sp. NPDC007861 TaxID=3154893 RepID=UPI0033DE088A